MTQPGLFDAVYDDPGPSVVCAFGQPWAIHLTDAGCPLCAAETERQCAEFASAVSAGIWDAQGYTPAERRAAVRA